MPNYIIPTFSFKQTVIMLAVTIQTHAQEPNSTHVTALCYSYYT